MGRFDIRTRSGQISAIIQGLQAVENGILDIYPNASAAYSLRLLRSTYTGSAIRVRRSSDNTESNIGFIGGGLDTTTLLSFCGAGSGFVTTWYDQSGNGVNSVQTTAANQPQIVNTGSVILQGGKPILLFDGTNDYLDAASVTSGNPKSIFLSSKFTSLISTEIALYDSVTSNQAIFYKDSINRAIFAFGATVITSYTITLNYTLYSIMHNGSTSNAFVNSTNQIITNSNLGTNAFNGLRIGASRGSAALFYNGNIGEFIVYGSDQSSNRTGIETNINTYYAIY